MSDNEPIRVNFAGMKERPKFYLLPTGLKVVVEIEDYEEDSVSDEGKNPGAPMINWIFTIQSTLDGEETVTSRVRDPETKKASVEEIKVEGRRIYDRMVIVEGMYPRVKEFLDANWMDTEGDIEIVPEQMLGFRFGGVIGIQRGQKDKVTGKKYRDRNGISRFFPLDDEKPTEVVAETPSVEEKDNAVPEEAPV